MEINRINQPALNKVKGRTLKKADSPFGSDQVSIGKSKHMNLIKPAQIKKLFEAGKVKWSITPGDGSKSFMVAKDGSVYMGQGGLFESSLTKLDGKTGKKIWEQKFNKELDSFPATESPDGKIYVCTTDCLVRALDPKDGSTQWKFDMDVRGGDPVFAQDGTVYSQYSDDLFVMKPNGKKRFRYRINDYMHSVAHVDKKGASILYSKDKGLVALTPSGKKMWNTPAKSFHYNEEADPDHIYTKSDNTLCSLDRMTGKVLWEKSLENDESSIAGSTKDKIYVEEYEKITCLDASNGEVKWEKETPGGARVRLVGDDGTLYTGNSKGKIEALDPGTGKVKWSVDTNDDAYYGSQKITSKGMLLINNKTVVMGIDIKSGKFKFRYSSPKKIESFQVSPDEDIVYVREEKPFKINAVEIPDAEKIAQEIQNSANEELQEKTESGIEVGDKFVEIGGVKLERKGKA